MQNKEDLNTSNLSESELSRYSRHLSLPEIGIEGQIKLKSSSVLCIGCGGLGSPLLMYLAAAGIGRIGIVDLDLVEDSNLQRQVIHSTMSIGEKKTRSAKKYIQNLNPFCKVEMYETKLTNKNALEIIDSFDIVCDCTDNFPSRYLINDSCLILKKPNIYGSVAAFEGQVSVFNLTSKSPNYRDLIPCPPPKDIIPNCSEGGVMGILPGIVGLLQATEAIKIITGIGKTLDGRVLVFDALKMVFKELKLTSNKNEKKIEKLIDYNKFCSEVTDINNEKHEIEYDSISVESLRNILQVNTSNITLIDVREKHEFIHQSIDGSILISLQDIKAGKATKELQEMASKSNLYLYCKSGKRSLSAIKELNKLGIKGINIQGGIEAWNKEKKSHDFI